jgi:hypothetical protein
MLDFIILLYILTTSMIRQEAPLINQAITKCQQIFALPIIRFLALPFGIDFRWEGGLIVRQLKNGEIIYRNPRTHRSEKAILPRR